LGEAAGSSRLDSLLQDLRSKHGIKSVEIKGRVMDRRPSLVPDLLQELLERRVPVFAELMDKRYFIAMNLVNHVFGRTWLDVSSAASLALANAFADALAEDIDQSVLVSYGEFAIHRSAASFEAFAETCRHAFFVAKVGIGAEREEQFELIWTMEKAFESALGAIDANAEHDEFLPSPDHDARGNHLPMLPHVPALTNIYARINHFARGCDSVRVVHDEQARFGPLLAGYASTLESNRHFADLARAAVAQKVDWNFSERRFALSFARSVDEPGIQLADVLARFLSRQLGSIITTGEATADLVRVAPLLRALRNPADSNGINIVSTTKRADSFHGA
jgi:hypothetical protein